ncbi:MAG TPA: ATP-binding domain-containing protein [Streptosporangiaceae bacterium]|nr:ATP-binding domain-containing protein [Streptosporangiaceae bacterium]
MSQRDVGQEQAYLSMLYTHLDGLRDRASGRLAATLRQTGGTPQARTERDVNAVMYTQRIAQLDAAENGLCFGRIDFHDGEPRYIGRMGIRDEADDYEPLLLDWRAPAARPFYLATPVSPEGVRRRRHIKTLRREVIRLDDEVLDLTAAGRDGLADGLTGEAALLAALNASRTGQMSDIVETIQVEQDWIIRSPHKGVLVVQGGPGTGKTAVALHRAAYLLYTHREQLARRAVLIIGPNPTFLRYVGQVLPSLGETSVLLSTIADLYPGVSARRDEPAAAAVLKGRLDMAKVIAAAVRDRQGASRAGLEVSHERDVLRLDRRACARIRDRVRRSRMPHNRARGMAHRLLIDALTSQVADRLGFDVLGGGNLLSEDDVTDIRQELRESPQVRAALEEFWPLLTPHGLVADLFAAPDRLSSAGRGVLSAEERSALLRPAGGGWTPADVPLLDEAAELLGEDDRAARARGERERRRRIAYARGVLDLAYGSRSVDLDQEEEAEILSAYDILDAERLADRYEEDDDRTAVERAAADRTWAFGHIVVDEAQELSPLAWRMLMRRCPARSMTVVGDMAQGSELGGGSSWQDMLGPHLDDRWRLERLTINYRTPAEIADVAGDVLAAIDPELHPPRPVREAGVVPWARQAIAGELPAVLGSLTRWEADRIGAGRLAVIVPGSRLTELTAAVAEAVPDVISAEAPDLDRPVVVLSVTQAKGLEFDAVLVADPHRILADSPRGLNDLYVAITRATQHLGVVHENDLPKVLSRLRPLPDADLA